jgi:hypothetical protein
MVLSQALINAAREGDLAAVQEWLDAGGDPDDTGSFGGRSRTLLHHVASAHDPSNCYHPDDPHPDDLRESARMLKEARLLRPRLRAIFALRALCHRGRAAPTAETPEASSRLIGSAPASQPKTRAAAAAKVPASPGLPDPLAHLVCKFWLGEPPRRRRAAPATE